MAEVRQISDTRTAQQLATIDEWLDGNNSVQPPGHWNTIASDLITEHQLSEAAAARVLAILNVAMMDTHIVLSGVHYRFDVDAGLSIGRVIAAEALRLHDRSDLLALLATR